MENLLSLKGFIFRVESSIQLHKVTEAFLYGFVVYRFAISCNSEIKDRRAIFEAGASDFGFYSWNSRANAVRSAFEAEFF